MYLIDTAYHLYYRLVNTFLETLDVDQELDITHEISCTSPYLVPRQRRQQHDRLNTLTSARSRSLSISSSSSTSSKTHSSPRDDPRHRPLLQSPLSIESHQFSPFSSKPLLHERVAEQEEAEQNRNEEASMRKSISPFLLAAVSTGRYHPHQHHPRFLSLDASPSNKSSSSPTIPFLSISSHHTGSQDETPVRTYLPSPELSDDDEFPPEGEEKNVMNTLRADQFTMRTKNDKLYVEPLPVETKEINQPHLDDFNLPPPTLDATSSFSSSDSNRRQSIVDEVDEDKNEEEEGITISNENDVLELKKLPLYQKESSDISSPRSPKNLVALMAGLVTMGTLAVVRSPRIIARKDFPFDRQMPLSSLYHAVRSGDILMNTGANLVSSGIRAGMNGKVSHIAVIWVDRSTDIPYIAHSTNHDYHPHGFQVHLCQDYFVGKVINGVQMIPLLPYLRETFKHEHSRYIWRPLCHHDDPLIKEKNVSPSSIVDTLTSQRLSDAMQITVDQRLKESIKKLHARPWPSHADIWQRYYAHGSQPLNKPGNPDSMLCNEFVVSALRDAGILVSPNATSAIDDVVSPKAWQVLPTVFEAGGILDQTSMSMMHPAMRYGPEHYITYDSS